MNSEDDPIKKKSWTKYVHKRISANQNFICAVTGPTGSAKSYSALSWAEELQKDFSVDQIVFTPSEFMELVNSNKLKKGSVIMFDEIGVALNSKEHMSLVNKSLNFFMQTFRHRNWILLMTCPHLMFLDASVRRLMHAHAETVKIDRKKKKSFLKIFYCEVSQKDSKIYRKYLRAKKNGRLFPIKRVVFGLPSEHLIQAYERKKTDFTDALNHKIQVQIRRAEEEEYGVADTFVQLTDVQERVLEHLKSGLDLQKVGVVLGVTQQAVSNTKRLLMKKGYRFKQVRDAAGLHYEVKEPNV